MQYHHIYHAGNFADVFKHVVLITLVEALCQKDKPFLYLDTHAGIGRYDLTSKEARKIHEYDHGIYKIYAARKDCPKEVKTYLKIVRSLNQGLASNSLPHFYPGSPLMVRSMLRSQDNMILCELHPEDVKLLQREFRNDKQVAVHHTDGFKALKAFLPPREAGRALTLIDPAFEDPDEFNNIVAALKVAYERFPHGVYAIWYPIKDELPIREFYQKLRQLKFKKLLIKEFTMPKVRADDKYLRRCGMAILNPPWQFAVTLVTIIHWLQKTFISDRI